MNSSASGSPTVFKVSLSDSEYYLIEIREKSGIDDYTLHSASLVVYIVNNMRESAGRIVDVLNGGVVVQGGFYSDVSRSICASFVSFNSSAHIARVGLSTQLFFVRVNLPDSIDYFSTITGKVRVFDGNNNPVRHALLNITVDENISILRVTDENGEAIFELNFRELEYHTIRVTSPSMLAGETEIAILVSFPWQSLVIALLLIALLVLSAITLIKFVQRRRSIFASSSTTLTSGT